MAIRRFLLAAVLGAVLGTITTLLFGWLIHYSIPASVGAALVYEVFGLLMERKRIRQQIHAYVHNMKYLKTL